MKKIRRDRKSDREYVDYIGHFRDTIELPHPAMPDSAVINIHNEDAMDTDMDGRYISDKQIGQKDFYIHHKKYGGLFQAITKELDQFLFKYPNVPRFLLTVATGSDEKYEENMPFAEVGTSNDEKEQYEWDKERPMTNDSEYRAMFDSYEVINEHQGRLLLHESWVYGLTDDPVVLGDIANDFWVDSNPNWAKSIELSSNDGNVYEIDGRLYSDETQSAMAVLTSQLSNETILWKSHHASEMLELYQTGNADFLPGVREDGWKVGYSKFPVLHPRVKSYLGLIG